ncbi:MAG: cell division protein FtsA [Rhodospirillales bacterium]|nr:cell division protein FtsA [Rhodospirillales bacterium]
MQRALGRTKNSLVAALDVGSTKTCCFLAEVGDDARPRVIGIGQQVSRGLRHGTVVDMDATTQAIGKAVHSAEQMAGQQIEEVFVNMSGGNPASRTLGVDVALSDQAVSQAELDHAIKECHALDLEETCENDRDLIHSIPVGYAIDGSCGIKDPRGMFGRHLRVELHSVSAAASALRNLTTCIERAHLSVAGVVVSPYASGLAALVGDEMEMGVTVIDLGGGTTSLAAFFEGNIVYSDVLPVGGDHVTNDIARGLSTPRVHAERLKTLYGHAMSTLADEQEMVDVPQVGEEDSGSQQQVARSVLVNVIKPRLEEILELVRNRLAGSGVGKLAGRRVVLTGGAAQLPGLGELAALILDKQVRIGRPIRIRGLAEATSGPCYTTCAGLLTYALAADLSCQRGGRKERGDGLFGRLSLWIKEHF